MKFLESMGPVTVMFFGGLLFLAGMVAFAIAVPRSELAPDPRIGAICPPPMKMFKVDGEALCAMPVVRVP
jgi:hypothetical protein